MEFESCIKNSFCVIGKEGSTREGTGFIQRLWQEANSHFSQISACVKRDVEGDLSGIWGAMSDLSLAFQPWEDNHTRGLYLAGFEADESAIAPPGWTRWRVPAFEYLYTPNDKPDSFARGVSALQRLGYTLAGAVQEFTCPQSGRGYLYYPIRRIEP